MQDITKQGIKEEILKKLDPKHPISVKEMTQSIYKTNNINEKQIQEVREVFEDMIKSNEVSRRNDKKELYVLSSTVEGVVKVKRNGDGYVVTDKFGDIQISKSRLEGAMNGDKVLVKVTDIKNALGTIKEIVERKGIVAEVLTIKGKTFAIVNGTEKYAIDFSPEQKDKIVDGTLIGIKIDKKLVGKYLRATLDKVIDHKNSPNKDDEIILYSFGAKSDVFSEEVLNEVKNVEYTLPEQEISKRRDLRNEMIFTIDGKDTKDIDDAISIKKLENGNYILGVHIANVSYYVKEDSALDLEARERGTSVYLPGCVSPMYPRELSNGICSLNPGVDRFAITCEMELDKKGNLVNYNLYRSVIKSRIQMTYDNVNKILEENIIPEGYEEYADTLKEMKELFEILEKSRRERGMLDFDSPEVKIDLDINKKVSSIGLRNLGVGENLIEQFMLEANECVGTHMFNLEYNYIYRIHDLPNEDKLREVVTYLRNKEKNLGENINMKDPKVLQQIIAGIQEDENFDIYANMLLRCMAKAVYSVENTGHFAVGIRAEKKEAYTHFTSPIRRYPDTLAHRLLEMLFDEQIEKLNSDVFAIKMENMAKHSSEKERSADEAERAADKMRMAQFMEDKIGQEFKARIISFTPSGMFLKLDNYVEGRVGYNSLGEFYEYLPEQQMLIGSKTGRKYLLGDKVNVILVNASKDKREIDLEIIDNRRAKESKKEDYKTKIRQRNKGGQNRNF